MAAADTPLLMLNAPLVASRLGYPDLSGLDLLELFAFVHPARFCVPTPKGLAARAGAGRAGGDGDVPLLLQRAAAALLDRVRGPEWLNAKVRGRRCNRWRGCAGRGRRCSPNASPGPSGPRNGCSRACPNGRKRRTGRSRGRSLIEEAEIEARLARLTGEGAEQREGQRLYARGAGTIFAPRARDRRPHLLLAQAGTGIGKTLGYLAPASLWAELSGGTVWVSTYTKNLQRQLRRESAPRMARRPADGTPPVVVRKGRENYLCLLNLEDALQGGFGGRAAILAQLVARWAAYSRDGDMIGGDLPGWLGTLFRKRGIAALTDQRGECVYAGCPHYRKCFIERAARASAQADLVIANHALVMVNAARGRDPAQRPTRIMFDEGHHVFDAADSTFAAALTGQEAIELRRWIIGPGTQRTRPPARVLRRGWPMSPATTRRAARRSRLRCEAAQALPVDGWLARLAEGAPAGPVETLLAAGARGDLCARRERRTGSGLRHRDRGGGAAGELVEAAGQAEQALAAIRRAADPPGRAARGGDGGRARLARRTGPRADRRGAPFARLADRPARRMGSAARPAGRPGRSRIRRLAGGRSLRRARIRRRHSIATGSTR